MPTSLYFCIVFLLSMMVINANLSYVGFFRKAPILLLRCIRSPLSLLIVITFGCGIFFAFSMTP
ncbi:MULTISPECIES: hypothetical protein [unclassified Anabaena]|uniref:hypothetical protein n=1 Tax=unclassified Anabaena TaxID=2619674 RepID=UPI0019007A5C|nr:MULTISPECIES: hypothetical protein [unclassified Anabaena]